MSTDVPVHQYTCSVYFLFFCVSYAMTFQLIYWSTYSQIHPKIHLPVYIHASLSSNHKGLPVTTTTCVPAHICTRSWPYLFIFIHSFRLSVKIYPSTFPLFYMSTDVPVHQYTCSVQFLFFGITCAMTFQLIYWGTYTQIHPKVNLPVYLHASLPSNHKGLPVTTTTCVHAHVCTRSWPYVFIFRLSFRLTVKIYPFTVLLFYMSTDVPVQQYTCSVCLFFFGVTCTMTFQLICWGTYTQIYPKIYLPVYLHDFLSSNHKDLPVTTTTCVHAPTYTQIQPEINVPVYLHTSPLSNNKDLPVTPNTCVPAHRCTPPWPYLFIFILHFRLNVKIYLSTFLQLCMTMFICLFSRFSFV